jgi:ATP:ADP antiporter, AAA family
MIRIIERELSVSAQVWQGYRLLDRPEVDSPPDAGDEPQGLGQRNIEHVFSLLATIIAREPLDAARQGMVSPNAGVRGLAVEYLDQVLPAGLLAKLRLLIDVSSGGGHAEAGSVTPSSGDVPGQSARPPRASQS